MYPKRLFALTLFAALAVMPPCALRAQWQPTNGLYGGSISSFASKTGEIFVNGIFRSTNGGLNWSEANKGTPAGYTLTLLGANGSDVFATGYYNNVYIWSDDSLSWVEVGTMMEASYVTSFGVKDSDIFAGTTSGIQRSTDNGKTWAIVNNANTNYTGTNVTAFAVIDSFLFAGMDDLGILRSSDDGDHWAAFDSSIYSLDVYSLTTFGKTIFAGTNGGLEVSGDYGTSWVNVSNGPPSSEVDALVVLGNSVIAGTWDYGIFISTNNGLSWQTPVGGLPQISIYSLAVSGDTLFAGTSGFGVFRSIDTGRTWTPSSVGLVSEPVSVLFGSGPNIYANGGELFRSSDLGMNWEVVESAENSTNMDSVLSLFVGEAPNVYSVPYGAFLSTDTAATWNVSTKGIPNDFECFTLEGSTLFAGTEFHGVFVTTDKGANWTEANSGLPTNSQIMSLCTTGKDIVAGLQNAVGSTSGVFLSSDDGQTWVSHNNGLPTYSQTCTLVASNDTIIFANLYSGGLFRSSINDTTWTPLSIGGVTSFAIADTVIFVGAGSGIFESDDNGDNWVQVDSGITYPYILSLAVYDSMLFAGTSSEGTNAPSVPTIWHRPLSELIPWPYTLGAIADTINFDTIPMGTERLRTATVTNDGKDALTISSFQLTQSQNAFTTSDLSSEVSLNPGEHFTFEAYFMPTQPGVFTANISVASEAKRINIVLIGTASGAAGVEEQSEPNSLLTIYPNPFSQSTQITFTSQTAGYAEVSIVNMLGVEVARVFSGELGAGEHSFTWDAGKDACTAGVYECLVRMNGQAETLPVMLMQ